MKTLKSKAILSIALFAGLGALFANPNASQAAEKPSLTVAAAASAPLIVKNYTSSSLRVYVDNRYVLYVPAFSTRTVMVSQSYHVYRAITRDGRAVSRFHRMKAGGMAWSIRVR